MSYQTKELSDLENELKWTQMFLTNIKNYRRTQSLLIGRLGFQDIEVMDPPNSFEINEKDLLELLASHYWKSAKGCYHILHKKDIDPDYLARLTKV